MKTELEALASSSDNAKEMMTSGENEYLRMSYVSERQMNTGLQKAYKHYKCTCRINRHKI
jgi:hypothetical protein